jgi:hypothetical protein
LVRVGHWEQVQLHQPTVLILFFHLLLQLAAVRVEMVLVEIMVLTAVLVAALGVPLVCFQEDSELLGKAITVEQTLPVGIILLEVVVEQVLWGKHPQITTLAVMVVLELHHI